VGDTERAADTADVRVTTRSDDAAVPVTPDGVAAPGITVTGTTPAST
jgi:hypothetical protein